MPALLQTAADLNLSSDRRWLLLLHYKPAPFWPGVNSLVDSPEFFLTADGKTNPQAELAATVLALFGADKGDRATLRCRFPARYLFLEEQLLGKTPDLKQSLGGECPKLLSWISDFQNAQLTLVFASAFLNNPASMFGHTFLRLDTPKYFTSSPLLDYAISFAARTQEEKGPLFAAKGLSGFYKGSFGLSPYHTHVRDYGSIDDRDLWEYSLNFTAAEVETMLLHLWELRHAYFDYYFVDENCSYHLLSLLEVARPALDLTSSFRWYAIPSDTLRQVMKSNGILRTLHLRPSKSREVRERARILSPKNRKLAAQLAAGKISAEESLQAASDSQAKSDIFALALDTVQYQKNNDPKNYNVYEQREVQLLRAANRFATLPQRFKIDESLIRPDYGHASRRLQLKYGSEDSEQFWEAEFRLSYHDETDPAPGFPEGATLEFFKTSVRYQPDRGNTSIEEATVVEVFSRPVWNEFIRPFSWAARLGASRRSFSDNESSLVPELKVKGGITFQPLEQLSTSLLATGGLQTNARLDDHFASGAGLQFLGAHESNVKWRTEVSISGDLYFNGFSGDAFLCSISERYALGRNFALVGELVRAQEYGPAFSKVTLSLRSYF